MISDKETFSLKDYKITIKLTSVALKFDISKYPAENPSEERVCITIG